jgi:lysyl-tRNA synthetase class 2
MTRGNTEPARDYAAIKRMPSVCCGFDCAIAVWAGWKFKRQAPIDRFIVDFFCADAELIVELDGGQHGQDRDRDADRTRVLEAMRYLLLRFWNHDVVRNMDGVLEEILSTINQPGCEPPHPTPLPYGEREHT